MCVSVLCIMISQFQHNVIVTCSSKQILQKSKKEFMHVCVLFFLCSLGLRPQYDEEKGRGDTCLVRIHGVVFVVCVTG